MKLTVTCAAWLLVAGATGCTSKGKDNAAPPSTPGLTKEKAVEKAEKAVASLMGPLVARLNAALGKGPPEKALEVCADSAQTITQEKAKASELYLRRTALRLRNPANAPDDYERAVLERWLKEPGDPKVHHEVVDLAGGGRELRYLKPIVLLQACQTCHGTPEDIPEAVQAELAKRYPKDEAIGFRPGDLRGAVSVRVPLGG